MISWSSLDWDRGRWNQIDLVLGTLFDVGVHAMNVWLLFEFLSLDRVVISLVVCCVYLALILYNPKLAWASFNNQSIPDWIKKKVKPLTDQQRQEFKSMEQLDAWLSY